MRFKKTCNTLRAVVLISSVGLLWTFPRECMLEILVLGLPAHFSRHKTISLSAVGYDVSS